MPNATKVAAQSGASRRYAWMGGDVGFQSRWIICWLLFLVTAINYLDRQVFSILIPDLRVLSPKLKPVTLDRLVLGS